MNVTDLEYLDSTNDLATKNNCKENKHKLTTSNSIVINDGMCVEVLDQRFKTYRGMLVFKPTSDYYTIDQLETMLIDFRLKQFLFNNPETRKHLTKMFPGVY